MTTSMLESKNLDANIWAEAMNFSAYIQNKVPHSSMKVKTPFEENTGHKLDVLNFRVFGSTAWDRIPLDKRKSLQPQSVEYILILYPEEEKGYKLLNIITKNILIERSVCFEEPLKDLELVEEETVEIPSRFAEDSDDENESVSSYI